MIQKLGLKRKHTCKCGQSFTGVEYIQHIQTCLDYHTWYILNLATEDVEQKFGYKPVSKPE
jgi:hypothetical protein